MQVIEYRSREKNTKYPCLRIRTAKCLDRAKIKLRVLLRAPGRESSSCPLAPALLVSFLLGKALPWKLMKSRHWKGDSFTKRISASTLWSDNCRHPQAVLLISESCCYSLASDQYSIQRWHAGQLHQRVSPGRLHERDILGLRRYGLATPQHKEAASEQWFSKPKQCKYSMWT